MRIAYLEFDMQEALRRMGLKQLKKLWNELLLMSAGDVDQAMQWLEQLWERHNLMQGQMSFEEFMRLLEQEGLIRRRDGQPDANNPEGAPGGFELTKRGERAIRKDSLEHIFRDLKSLGDGDHRTPHAGASNERLSETRPFNFGDLSSDIDFNVSIRNALKRGIDDVALTEEDLEVFETEQHASCATVLMIDISHSMILYGEDRITPAKKVAIALAELIKQKYPKDSVQVITFGNEAQEVPVHRLPYLQVGPFHTNTQAGLQLAQRLLGRMKHTNKQIFMITDGKPTVIHEQGQLYRNVSWMLDPLIVNRTLEEAELCRRRGITISTFMIAQDPHLVEFVDKLTQVNRGRAYFSALDKLGGNIFVDYLKNRRRRVR
ncbi:MAG: VWA domain-containing protein [Planctomycetes bacterium]|nr:VWA domain-containing protein [Planctomycetota bacterium]MCB9935837.1 VWA domain-containing protein [Planctomycetota bacterium]